jgi:hypothetical protein
MAIFSPAKDSMIENGQWQNFGSGHDVVDHDGSSQLMFQEVVMIHEARIRET